MKKLALILSIALVCSCHPAFALDEQTAIDSSLSSRVDTTGSVISGVYDPTTLEKYCDTSGMPIGMELDATAYFLLPETLSVDSLFVRFAGWTAFEDGAANADSFTVTISQDTLIYDSTEIDTFTLDTLGLDTFEWSYYDVDTSVVYEILASRLIVFEPYTTVEVSIAYHGDSLYYDTLTFRTYGDTRLNIPRRFDSHYGDASSYAFTITGYRSPGMDVYCSESTTAAIEANDTSSVEYAGREFEYSFTVASGNTDSISFWGLNEVGESSDTITVYRKYRQLFGFNRKR